MHGCVFVHRRASVAGHDNVALAGRVRCARQRWWAAWTTMRSVCPPPPRYDTAVSLLLDCPHAATARTARLVSADQLTVTRPGVRRAIDATAANDSAVTHSHQRSIDTASSAARTPYSCHGTGVTRSKARPRPRHARSKTAGQLAAKGTQRSTATKQPLPSERPRHSLVPHCTATLTTPPLSAALSR